MIANLIDNDHVRVGAAWRDSADVVVCFTGIGHAIGGIDVQGEEFFGASRGASTVFVIDKNRTWGNSINFKEIIKVISPFIEGKNIYTLGNSMGGFLAILSASMLGAKNVVAFVPQFSISKQVIPGERRWDRYVDHIDKILYPSLDPYFDDKISYYTFWGKNKADAAHRKLFPNRKNIYKIVFDSDDVSHDVAQHLKNKQVLYDVIRDCFNNRSAEELVSKRLNSNCFNCMVEG